MYCQSKSFLNLWAKKESIYEGDDWHNMHVFSLNYFAMILVEHLWIKNCHACLNVKNSLRLLFIFVELHFNEDCESFFISIRKTLFLKLDFETKLCNLWAKLNRHLKLCVCLWSPEFCTRKKTTYVNSTAIQDVLRNNSQKWLWFLNYDFDRRL